MKLVRLIMVCIGLFAVLVGVGLCHAISGSDPAPAGSGATAAAPGSSPAPAPTRPTTWRVLKTWTGSGMKTTEPFAIQASQWRVRWKVQLSGPGSLLTLAVKRPGNALPLRYLATVTASGEDTSYEYEAGEFVLDIMGANSRWQISVEVPEP